MAQETYEREIKGFKYTVRNVRPRQAWDLLIDVTKSFGPGAGALLDQVAGVFFTAKEGGLKEAVVGAVASGMDLERAVKAVTEGLDKAILTRAMDMLAEVTIYTDSDGKDKPLKSKFDDHFAGRVGAMSEWFVFALSSQYVDFFDSLRTALGR